MKLYIFFIGLIILSFFSFHTNTPDKIHHIKKDSPATSNQPILDSNKIENVYELLLLLGEKKPNHEIDVDDREASPLKGDRKSS